jgi:hypothetical protein
MASSTLSNVDIGDPVYRLNVASFCNVNPASLYSFDVPVFQSDFRLMPWLIGNLKDPSNLVVSESTIGNYPYDQYVPLLSAGFRPSLTVLDITL